MRLLSLVFSMLFCATVTAGSAPAPTSAGIAVPAVSVPAIAAENANDAALTAPASYVRWFVVYNDGVRVYNDFRSYRVYIDVYNYFTGNPGSHDCDAWYFIGTTRYRWCTRNAMSFARAHGGIRFISHY